MRMATPGLDAGPADAAAPAESDIVTSESMSRDDKELAAMGYKAELMRGFNGLMSFAFCFTAVSVLSSLSISMGSCLLWSGGPTVMVWGWFVVSIFTVIVGCSMGEVCSTYPSAGSVYHWTGQLAPEKWAPLTAYICGWFNFMGNVAGDAAFAYGFANFVNSARQIEKCPVDIDALYADALLNGIIDTTTSTSSSTGMAVECETYSVGAQVGIAMGVATCWAAMNVSRVDAQGWMNNLAMAWQVTTTIAIVVVLLVAAGRNEDFQSDHFTWEIWRNRTGLSDDHFGYVILIGLLSSLFSFSGYEAGAHMAEETRNASLSSALGLLATTVVTALVGLLYILGCIYSIPKRLGVFMALTAYGSPLPSLFCVVCGNRVGLILTNVVTTTLFFAGMSSLTVTSRIGFALARDGAFPGSAFLRRVNPWTKSPIPMVMLVLFIDWLLLLLPLATMKLDSEYGAIAFNAVTSICVIGYQISYCIPLMLRGTVAARTFVRSSFSLGRAGTFVANVAWIWLFITSLFLFWPTSFPVNQFNMNYTVVVVFGFFFIALLWWTLGGARHFFKGPLRVDANVFKQIALAHAAAEAAAKAGEPQEAPAAEAAAN